MNWRVRVEPSYAFARDELNLFIAKSDSDSFTPYKLTLTPGETYAANVSIPAGLEPSVIPNELASELLEALLQQKLGVSDVALKLHQKDAELNRALYRVEQLLSILEGLSKKGVM